MLFVISSILMMVLPIVLLIVVRRYTKLAWKAVALGAGMFLLAQVFKGVTGLPFMTILGSHSWLAVLIGALLPGVWEELTKYVPLRSAKLRSREAVISFGIGFGGVESLFLGINFLALAIANLTGHLPADKVTDFMLAQLNAPVGLGLLLTLAGLVERCMAIALHMTFVLINARAVRTGKLLWLGLAMLIHTLVDMGAGYMQFQVTGIDSSMLVLELFFLAIGVGCVWFIRRTLTSNEQ